MPSTGTRPGVWMRASPRRETPTRDRGGPRGGGGGGGGWGGTGGPSPLLLPLAPGGFSDLEPHAGDIGDRFEPGRATRGVEPAPDRLRTRLVSVQLSRRPGVVRRARDRLDPPAVGAPHDEPRAREPLERREHPLETTQPARSVRQMEFPRALNVT